MADAAEEGAILVACEVVAEDVGVAEDHVERRPQLVRHRRHELRLEPAGLLELLDEPCVVSAIDASCAMPRATRSCVAVKRSRRVRYPAV